MYNGVIRALQQLGLSDAYGNTRVPLYVLNVTYPLVDEEVIDFCAGQVAPFWWWRRASPNSSSRRSAPCCAAQDIEHAAARQGRVADGG